ncbi:MAG: T9SS type A sorting domain-containing protein, partial [Flavobacteriales bacterium]
DPNGSRLRAEGMYTAATFRAPGTMDGQVLEARLIQWGDDFTGIANAAFTNIPVIQTGEYFYEADLSEELIYIPFAEPVILEDNQRYLFCIWTPSDSVFIGHNSTLDYNENELIYDEPSTVISDNDTWYPAGFGSDVPTGIAVKFGAATDAINEIDRVDITPYPNPTANVLRIPLKGQSGAANLRVYDLSGAQVIQTRTSVGGDHTLTVDLAKLANGTYMFHMDFDNGQRSDFRVVVTK